MRRCKNCKREVYDFTIGEWRTAVCNCNAVVANTRKFKVVQLEIGTKYDGWKGELLETILQTKRQMNKFRMEMNKHKHKFNDTQKDEKGKLIYSWVK